VTIICGYKMLPPDLHGIWVSDTTDKGSYGRVAFAEDLHNVWVVWHKHLTVLKKTSRSASRADPTDLKVLPVTPEPWFKRCIHCGKFPFSETVDLGLAPVI